MSITTDSTDSSSGSLETQMSLIQQAQRDEPSAWELVYTLYAPLIRRWARGNGITCPHELENVSQDVFAKLVKNLRNFQHRKDSGSFRGWLRVITRNHVFTHLLGDSSLKTIGGSRWHRQLSEIPFGNKEINSLLDSVSEENPDENSLIFRKIVAWVDSHYKKRKRDRIVFRRIIIEERSVREVAQDLNVSTNVIYQIKSRMLAKIREVFNEIV